MDGSKIEQLKEAMHNILGQLHENDLFNLVEFNSDVKVWDIHDRNSSVVFQDYSDFDLTEHSFPSAYRATEDNIRKAKNSVSEFIATALTDIYSALRIGLHLVELAKQKKVDDVNRQPILVFLTDGSPTVGSRNPEAITKTITELNIGERQSPIFALSFGRGADRNFLQKLAIQNLGFEKHIYEAADAALQLQDFYRHISSPLLSNVHFKYEPSVTSLTKTEFSIHFGGSELVVSGKYGEHELKPPSVDAWGARGKISLKPRTIKRSISNIERLWAYLTIKNLLEKKEKVVEDKEEIKKKVLDLALQYSFVTPVSSLVVVKPNTTTSIDTEEAYKAPRRHGFTPFGKTPSASRRPVSGYSHGTTTLGKTLPNQDNTRNSGDSYVPRRHGGFTTFGKTPSNQDNTGFRDSYVPRNHGFTTFGKTPSNQDNNSGNSKPRDYVYRNTSSNDNLYHNRFENDWYPPVTRGPLFQSDLFTTTASSADLISTLPWLKNILSPSGLLILPSGHYELGLNETIPDNVACANTPSKTTGHCSLLHSCPQVHSQLINYDVFIQHSCIIRFEYAGVCCPESH